MRARFEPILWSSLILVISQVFTFYVAFRERQFIETYDITSPDVPLGIPLAYFVGAVVLLGIILFLIPADKLKIVFRIMFVCLFSWGMFIALVLSLNAIVAAIVSIAVGLVWFFWQKVWLHNLLMIFTLAGVGAVFGFLLSPWAAISLMGVISVYDILAVRFGYMLWMVKKLSRTGTLPAFVLPRAVPAWNLNLNKTGFEALFESESAEREFSLLGGGDIGFPLLLVVSVFFIHGATGFAIVAAFSLLGLISAFLFQQFLLKGKPMPALPPITFFSLVGFLIVQLT